MGADEATAAVLRAVARDHGTPCFVYFMDQVRARIATLRLAFGGRFEIRYAVKSNPNPGLLRRLVTLVDSFDVSSGGEVGLAIESGCPPQCIGFTGPGKTDAELRRAVSAAVGEVVVESVDEAVALDDIAAATGHAQSILVRIAPSRALRGFGVSNSGKPTQFGIDEEEIDVALESIRRLRHLQLQGLHIYSGTQSLNTDGLADNLHAYVDIFARVCRQHDLQPQRLVFGSGIGIPYYDADVAVDLDAVAGRVVPLLDALQRESRFQSTRLTLETGRYLVGEAGVYLTRVLRLKQSRGTTFGICDGGMNHHLGAAGHLGTVVQRNYRMSRLAAGREAQSESPYTLVGPLCTTIDTLARQVRFRGLEAGDLIAIAASGAYGLSASPIHFISHAPATEILVETVDARLTIEDVSQFGVPVQRREP